MDGNGHAHQHEATSSPPTLPPVNGSDPELSASGRIDELEVPKALDTPRISVTEFGSETPPTYIDTELEPEEPEPEPQAELEAEVVTPQETSERQRDDHESDDDNDSIPPPTPSKNVTEEEQDDRPLPPPPTPAEPKSPHSTNGRHDSRPLSPSLSTTSGTSTNAHKRSMTSFQGHHMSSVLLSSALDAIASSKEAKRSIPLKESTQKALDLLQSGRVAESPRDILEPLRLACETRNEKLTAVSLDCISKLIGFDFFADEDIDLPQGASPPPSPNPHNRRSSMPDSSTSIPQPSLVDLVAHTIVSCYTESTQDTVSVQIVKAILNLVVSNTTIVHHSSLLKCIRTVYNIYMLSAELRTQQVAQAALSQMVDHIFNRSKPDEQSRQSIERRDSLAPSVPGSYSETAFSESPRVRSTDALPGNNIEEQTEPTESTEPAPEGAPEGAEMREHRLTLRDLFVKDSFLIFRALCKKSREPLSVERILNSNMAFIVDPTSILYSVSNNEAAPFGQAIAQHLCLSVSKNVISPVPDIFEISVEIFWRILSGMRNKLKKEIEVLLHEIFIPILEMKTSTLKQKAVIMGMFSRLCQDPQALVEIYLNYDCDREAADNIYEQVYPSRETDSRNLLARPVLRLRTRATKCPHGIQGVLSVSGTLDTSSLGHSDAQLKRQALEALVNVLRSLAVWGTASVASTSKGQDMVPPSSARSMGDTEALRQPTPQQSDDPGRFESAKQRKTALLEGIKKFNYKPKKGIEFLIDTGFIPSKDPKDVATFLFHTDGLNKAMLGEYLGEGDTQNVAIMHHFVDILDFSGLAFVDALRAFLQKFRLPGESQKIDRFVLKFAERYIEHNPKIAFVNAETAYVLSYSVIMLNTDHYNPQVKNRMTKQDFIKNNRGINDGTDLPEEMLSEIFDDIDSNEIRMEDEIEAKILQQGATGLANALSGVGRDLQKEAYILQTSGMSNKTEAMFRNLRSSHRSDQFFSASHTIHVRAMLEVAWMAFLAGLSGPLQESEEQEVVELCLDGFKNAIRIACFFDLELQRNAFVTTLGKFTFLNNLGEMKAKNMDAIRALLDVAVSDGNNLKGSWKDVLTCVSQLEHMQLIGTGVDLPDKRGRSKKLNEELANESRSTHITVAADMVFSLSHHLSSTAIVDFVRALCAVSWEEIQSSGPSQHPRLFSLQKLVDISYYNMNRIRIEWSNLWEILGEHFNQVCCHPNAHVGFFALDALRQLAMRFLEKEELAHFMFQKDFLKPFEYTMIHNLNPDIRDMVLQCLHQMIQARVQNLRSGWRTMFGVFSAASKAQNERIAHSAFELVTRLNRDNFTQIVKYGAFTDLIVCITEFCKVSKYQKISLLAIAMLRGVIPVMVKNPECLILLDKPKSNPEQGLDEGMIKFWWPILFGFRDIIMNGEDLEVRRLALDSLFTTLKTYGSRYPVEFWDTVCNELLLQIFAPLKNKAEMTRFSTQEDMSVWLSTTMIQALRDLVDLYTFFFDTLDRMLDGLFDLLCICICQEDNTLSRIGTSCLQQFLESNVKKFSPALWEKVISTFSRLFRTTTPHQLFDESLRADIDVEEVQAQNGDANGSADGKITHEDRQRIFAQIIFKCILQLLLIETTTDLLRNQDFYTTIPADQLLKLLGVLNHSYRFAHEFNEDKDLRTGLWKVGFMKHLPNLLKQETTSSSTVIHNLLLMHHDQRPEYQAARPQIIERLLLLGLEILDTYTKLRPDPSGKNVLTWNPVVAETLDGFSRLDDKTFARYLSAIYPLAVELLSREIPPEIRQPLKTYFTRVGLAQRIIDSTS
ncbi:Sec7-domain-containing protein [Ephemerocybe angulata]|uniref:Sec7-domain-containing protein n=1 Tax=Ephemerocybe angulata TaxID=980116 RepID=A0A8H6IBU2_9AGAR|nr:Sec7-domain-containing protein [Tulosesus angulatus]